jgi:hypothetical protein
MVKSLKEEVQDVILDNVYFLQLPRTTLGVNIADFLNSMFSIIIYPEMHILLHR